MKPVFRLVLVAVAVATFPGPAPSARGEVVAFPPSTVYRITLEKFSDDRDPLVVTVYVRGGRPVHGYATITAEGQMPQRIDLSPAAPIEYVEDGKRFTPADTLKGNYDYKKPEFRAYRDRYNQKKVEMRTYDPPTPLAVSEQKLAGTFDLFLDVPDQRKREHFRITLDLAATPVGYAGPYTAHDYRPRDETFGVNVARFTGAATAKVDTAAWAHTADRAYRPGADWPQAHGPSFTGSAIDCQRDLIDNLADARLLWVADLPIPGGRQGIPRSEFGFFPINNSGLGMTQYSGPIVVGGKVYLAVPYPDEEALAAAPGLDRHPQVIRGADPRVLAADLGLLRDTLFCFDAQTGRVLWAFRDERKLGLVGESKSGRGLTAAYVNGTVVFRGQTALYGVDAESGALRWVNRGGTDKTGDGAYSFGPSRGLSTEDSPVIIGGVIVVRINDSPKSKEPTAPAPGTSLMGLDPATGQPLWRARHVTGDVALPTALTLDGQPYILAAYQGADLVTQIPADQARPEHRGLLTLLEPRTGKVRWQKPIVGPTRAAPVVWGDVAMLNVNRDQMGQDNKNRPIVVQVAGGVRVGLDDAKVVWTQPAAEWQDGRQTPIAHRGVFFSDSRRTGFQALKADSGAIIGQFPHLYYMAYGDHNWSWAVASNGRILTSGEHLLLFKLDNDAVKLMPGGLRVDLANGYVCPIRPALADGRLIVRTATGLACYDLRQPAGGHTVDTQVLRTDDLALGMAAGQAGVDLQVRMVNGSPAAVILRYPAYQNVSTPRPFAWGGVNAMRWRTARAAGLATKDDRTTGTAWVQVNEHVEPWTFDLTRSGQGVKGTVERSIPALPKPVACEGQVTGEVTTLPDQRTRHMLRLVKGGINGEQGPADVLLCVDRLADGTLLACGASAQVNQASFEVDCARLKVDGGRLHGDLAVIFHSDRFKHVRPDQASALAAAYRIDATVTPATGGPATLAGTFSGQVGGAYRRRVAVGGSYLAGRDVQVAVESAPASAPAEADEPDAEE